jgi:hypothetical protein
LRSAIVRLLRSLGFRAREAERLGGRCMRALGEIGRAGAQVLTSLAYALATSLLHSWIVAAIA